MEVSSVNRQSYQAVSGGNTMAKMKQLFENLGSALDSGNLSDAKDALAQLQKNTPTGSGNGDNPISAKVDKLSKAVDSGDLKGAQAAYADIKKKMAQRLPAQGGAEGKGGAPPSGAKQGAGASSSSSSNKDYDKKDLDKDGTVSVAEEFLYTLQHPEAEDTGKSSTTDKNDQGALLDTTA